MAEDPAVAEKILQHKNLPSRAPPRGPSRRPPLQLELEPRTDAQHDGVDAPGAFE